MLKCNTCTLCILIKHVLRLLPMMALRLDKLGCNMPTVLYKTFVNRPCNGNSCHRVLELSAYYVNSNFLKLIYEDEVNSHVHKMTIFLPL